jgi:hypothetical protein
MYLSKINNGSYDNRILSIELEPDFLEYIKGVRDKILQTGLNIFTTRVSHDTVKARFINPQNDCYEDRSKKPFLGEEDRLSYFGYDICKDYFPNENFWYEQKPDVVYLEIYKDYFGFSFEEKGILHTGSLINLIDWEMNFNI